MTSRNLRINAVAAGLLVALIAAGSVSAEVRDTRTIRKSFDLEAGGRVVVNNVWGSIEVHGTSGNQVELVVEEIVVAKDAEALERSRTEVKLLIESDASLVDLFVDGPFRDRSDREWMEPQELATAL